MKSDYTQTIPPEWLAMSKIFVALGDEHRQRILLLFEPGERLNVGQIAEVSTLGPVDRLASPEDSPRFRCAGFREDRQGGLVLDRPAGAGNHLYQCPRLSEGKLLMLRSLLRPLLRGLARLLFRVEVPLNQADFRHQRLLVVANHESFLDGLLIGLFLPIDPVFVVHTTIAENFFFRILLSQVDYLAVDPTSPMAMKKVIRLIESGRPVVIFPEGRITLTGSLMKVYDGPAFVAAKTGATVVPVRLDGASRSYFSRLSGRHPRALFPKIRLSILPERHFPMPEGATAKLRRRKSGEQMRKLMQEMIFASRPQQTLYAALCDTVEIHGRRRRLLEDVKQVEYSYNDLLKMALMLGRQIERLTQPGERVGLLLPNLAPTVGLIFGLTARRRIPAMLNYTAGVEAMQAAVDAAELKTVVTSRAFVEQAKLADKLAGLSGVQLVYLEDVRECIGLGDKLWLVLWALHFPRAFALTAAPEDPAVVLFTSGSEGKPKGVVLSHRAILSNIAQIRAVIDISPWRQGLQRAAPVPLLRSDRRPAAAADVRRQCSVPLPLAAALPGDPRAGLRPRTAPVLFGTGTFLAGYARFANPYDFYRLRYVVAGAEKLSEACAPPGSRSSASASWKATAPPRPRRCWR
jgi:acyl-[acyl-carrier-protein]-phospholipid O-acyltransferase/long-chain-fatty-acid--[acyl-carrier-protein] ligase